VFHAVLEKPDDDAHVSPLVLKPSRRGDPVTPANHRKRRIYREDMLKEK
jgi:hypothetical protein